MTDLAQLYKIADEAYKSERFDNYEVILQRLIELRPFNAEFKFNLAKVYAVQDKKSEAYNELILLQKAGLSYPTGSIKEFEKIRDTKVYEYIEDLMVKNGEPYGEGVKQFEISHHYSGMLFENFAYDSVQKRFLFGSIRAGSVYEYSEKSGFKEFINSSDPATGPWGVVDLVVDDAEDTLWTSSATMPHYNGTNQTNFGHAMISKYKLSTGELINNFSMQEPSSAFLFSAMHLTAGQDLYFINAFSSDIFKISKGSDQVELVLSIPSLKSIKAITSNSDETVLYISDFETGMYVINLETKQILPLVRSADGFFAGINDLFYLDGDLVGIQSGISPARIMRYMLKEDLIIQSPLPIEAAHKEVTALGNGLLVGDEIYYVANSQWEKVDAMGRLLPEQTWEPLSIIKSPTNYRMEEFLKQQRDMEEIKRKRGFK
jgi:hypothetical protein